MIKITATFLDEITSDIPSNNWGPKEWERDFRVMKSIGIDTVIMIRSGFKKIATFDSEVLKREADIYPVYEDLPGMFLDLCDKYKIDFYFPTYDSWAHWMAGDYQKEVDINKALVEEIWQRYGHYNSFKGWYLANEFGRPHGLVNCVKELGVHCKRVSGGLPCIISPFIQGIKCGPGVDTVTPEIHKKEWSEILGKLEGAVDIVAFQDGHCEYEQLPVFQEINVNLIRSHGMRPWSNLETFDRDMPIRFPPTDFRKLWWKLTAADKSGVERLLTFEFSHFMSPYSCWPSARNLFRRYCEFIGLDPEEVMTYADQKEELSEVL